MEHNTKVDIEYVEKFYDALRQGRFTDDPDKFAEYFIDHIMSIALCEKYIAYAKLLKGSANGILVTSNRYVNDRDKILFSSVIRLCNIILDTGNFDQNHFYMDLRSTAYSELYGLGNRGQDLAMG